MFDYTQLKQFLIDHLTRDADSHMARRYSEIGTGFGEMEANLLNSDEEEMDKEEFDKLFLARSFWEGWIDARNHDWSYYEHIEEDDWPILAKRIAVALAHDLEISNPQVFAQFRGGA